MKTKYALLYLLTALAVILPGPFAFAKEAKVVIFPFDVHSAEDITHIQSGIAALLPSRIAVPGRIAVVDSSEVKQELTQKSQAYTMPEKLAAAKKLGADYFLAGSITKIGAAISVDSQLVDVTAGRLPMPVFTQSTGLDTIIPELNVFAKKVKDAIIGGDNPPPEEAALAREPAAAKKTRPGYAAYEKAAGAPEEIDEPPAEDAPPVRRRLKKYVPEKQKKPVFRQPAPPFEAAPYFSHDIKSKPLSFACAGDVNGDGKQELILAGSDQLRIYQVTDKALTECGAIKLTMDEHIVHVDAADINGNKTDELYISSYDGRYANSFVAEYSQGEYKRIPGKPLKYFFRIYKPADDEALLIGQEAGVSNPFSGSIFQFEWKDGRLIAREEFLLPGSHGIYSFTEADTNGDENKDYLVFDKGLFSTNYQLTIFSTTGKSTWRDIKKLGGSPSFFTKYTVNEMQEQEFIPMRIICDYFSDSDALPTVIVGKNSRKGNTVIDKLQSYNQGQVQCLAWSGSDLEPTWTSEFYKDYVTDYLVDDIDNDTRKELYIISVSGEEMFGKATNRITVYRQAAGK